MAKPLIFIGSSRSDLSRMPEAVKETFGFALYTAQQGGRAGEVKQLTGFGGGVMQISEDDDGNTYRAVYTVHFADVVYVLHCFQKKSKQGRKTPSEEINVIEARLKRVKELEDEKAKARKAAARSAPKNEK